MYFRRKSEAPAFRRPGVVSRMLLGGGDVAGSALMVTWVEIAPGAAQGAHSHAPEQTYTFISGTGVMHVAGEMREVKAGDLVHVPPNAMHHAVNTGREPLVYVSATTPPFAVGPYYDRESVR